MSQSKTFITTVVLSLVFGLTASTSHANQAPSYRTIGKAKYRIVDTTGFYIYSINKLVNGEKIARATTVYYFSVQPGGDLQELTLANLQKAYASNVKFRYSLQQMFHSDKSLMEYDGYTKEYKVKYLYRQSL